MNRLKNKVAVITGASKGLGRELALAFAEKGTRCILCARSNNLQDVVDEIQAKNGQAVGIQADVSSEDYGCSLVEATVSNYDGLDIWVNNAGIWYQGPIEEIDGKKMQKLFEVNVFGTIYGSREALKYMKKQGRGHIINIISTSGKAGKTNHAVYAATKFAISGFTESLRNEAYQDGIRISAVYPGGMKTHFFEKESPDMDISGFMDAKDVAQLIVYHANLPENMLPKELVLMRM